MGEKEAREFREWAEKVASESSRAAARELYAALLSIASLSDGDEVSGSFDEPGAAQVAREVLSKQWIGPCVHGRDPWDRCDEACELVPDEVAWAWAQRASNPTWRAKDEERQKRLMGARHG